MLAGSGDAGHNDGGFAGERRRGTAVVVDLASGDATTTMAMSGADDQRHRIWVGDVGSTGRGDSWARLEREAFEPASLSEPARRSSIPLQRSLGTTIRLHSADSNMEPCDHRPSGALYMADVYDMFVYVWTL